MTIQEILKDKSRKIFLLESAHKDGELIRCKAVGWSEKEMDIMYGGENTQTFKIQKLEQLGLKIIIKTPNGEFSFVECENQEQARQEVLRRYE